MLEIKKRKDEIERAYLYTDKQYARVPNVIGMNVEDAVKELKKFKVEYSGTGDIITYQSPESGEAIYEGETVRLLLSE